MSINSALRLVRLLRETTENTTHPLDRKRIVIQLRAIDKLLVKAQAENESLSRAHMDAALSAQYR